MRIAIVNWSRRKVGGVETYLSSVIPELQRSGHELAFWHEIDKPANRERIALPDGVPSWCVADLGAPAALAALRAWRPELIYAHGLVSPKLEAAMIKVAPSVFFAHNYYGTCISGDKTFKRPVVTPCDRRFGTRCLAQYYPHRCGGLSPLTMLKLYRRQAKRLGLLSDYKAIITHSEHMRDEYIKHGIEPERIYDLLYYVRHRQQATPAVAGQPQLITASGEMEDAGTARSLTRIKGVRPEWRLLFLGRMDFLKGGAMFLDALPQINAALERPLRVTFGGDGPERRIWERKARRVQARCPAVRIEFTGWLVGSQLDSLLDHSDLLVLPSLWPEPFGLVGPEAGLRGVPVAAFGVGGIPNWLVDGFNGHVASGAPPTSEGLAEAVIKCLRDPATHARLGRGAIEIAQRFSMERHLSALQNVLENVMAQEARLAS
jgi:glycosyltransferase involved in cell wall biosynthesis